MIEIYHRDSLSLPAEYVKHFDAMITDPPYRKHVHEAATSQSKIRGTRKRDLGFDPLSEPDRAAIGLWSASVRRWSVIYSDVEDSHLTRFAAEQHGAQYIRTIPWVRWSMPQLSGDRPPQGFEHVLCFHAEGKKRWNGPGNLTHLDHKALRGEEKHKCEKPLDQALDLVSFFSDIGDSVFDPFAGHATIGLACKLLGRNYVGFENDPSWYEKATLRLAGRSSEMQLERDALRVIRWLQRDKEPGRPATDREDQGNDASPDNVRRREARALDKENVRKGVFL